MRARPILAVPALAVLTLAGLLLFGGSHPSQPAPTPTGALATPTLPTPALSTPTLPTPAAGHGTRAPGASPNPVGLDGTLFYLAIDSSGGTVLHAVIGGGTRTLASFPDLAPLAVNVAPDGRQVAWIQNSGTPVLIVANVDGSGRRTVSPVDADPCTDPQWSADSRRVMVMRTGQFGTLDIATGTFTPLAKPVGCHPVWGQTNLAYGDGSGKVFVANPDGSGARAIPNLGAGDTGRPRSFDIESISPDGTKAVLDLHIGNMDAGDVARGLNGNAVLDTRTGAKISTPPFDQALFVPGGNLLIRKSGTLTLLAPDGHRLVQLTEPATAKEWLLLSYSPAS